MITPDDISKALERLDKMQFFMGQRAGRELWNDKPHDMQELDLEQYNRDVETVRAIIQQLQAERDALLEAVKKYWWSPCSLCKHVNAHILICDENDWQCDKCDMNSCACKGCDALEKQNWEWRGVQKEEN